MEDGGNEAISGTRVERDARNLESLCSHTLNWKVHAKLPWAFKSYATKGKKNIFNILGSKGKSLENFTFDFDVPKSILLSKDET